MRVCLQPVVSRVRGAFACAVCIACAAAAWAAADQPLDPIQQAVVDSLASRPRTTPAELLEAATRAADVEAAAAADEWLHRFMEAVAAAGNSAPDLLADAGDTAEPAALVRLERLLRSREPKVREVVASIRDAARLRRGDPARLARDVADLGSDSAATRQAAADRLARAGVDALPAIVPPLGRDDVGERPRRLARELVAQLGADARQPLLDWLATDDVADWPGVIEALDASGATDIETFLLAPAIVTDTPPAVREAARRVLARRAAARGGNTPEPPPHTAVVASLVERLDRTLLPAGLPHPDHLCLEPVTSPDMAVAAFGGDVAGLVERRVWNAKGHRFDRVRMTPRAARARDALHLARDLAAVDARDREAVNLVLLARMESLLVSAGDASGLPPKELQEVLAGPDGFTPDTAADVLDAALVHGMWEAAGGVAAALAPARGERAAAPLPPAARKALVRALAVPDAALQFTAARTLALAAGEPPYAGSSRVVEVLMHAATSTGIDHAVVAHPDGVVVDELATGVSRFGYEPVRATTGREAIFAARTSADTVLVIVAARLATPSALETTQLLQQQGLGDTPAVLVVVDPLDDDGRGRFLQRLLLSFGDLHRVAIVDRLPSLFAPVIDTETGTVTLPPRLPDLLAQAAGPAMVDPATREMARLGRLARSREAFTLLSALSRRGWDVRSAAEPARKALMTEELYGPAVSLLATLGRPEAQEVLALEAERGDLAAPLRKVALSGLAAHVDRYGPLLECGQLRGIAARYTREGEASRDAAAILDVLDSAGPTNRPAAPDASHSRPIR